MKTVDLNPTRCVAEVKLAYEYSPKILSYRLHHRAQTGLLYIENGEYRYNYGKESFKATKGNLVYLPQGSIPYEYRVLTPGAQTRVFQIEFSLINADTQLPITLENHPILIEFQQECEIQKMFETVIQCERNSNRAAKFRAQSILYNLLSVCAQSIGDTNARLETKISPAVAYINENYTSPIQIKKLAELCYVSESQLRRLFIKAFGLSPLRYKNKLLIENACRLLNNFELNIGEISNILGFCDLYAFSHAFVKEMGVSPRIYRNKLQG